MKYIISFLFIIIFISSSSTFAQKIGSFKYETVDVIYFKSGNIVRGKIKEISNESIKIRTIQGSVYIFDMEGIAEIGREAANKQRSVYIPRILIFTSGGYTIPISNSDFSKIHEPGVGINIGIGYEVSKLFTLRLDVQYNNLPYKVKSLPYENPNVVKKHTEINPAKIEKTLAKSFSTLKLELLINKPVNSINPYGIIGAGAYFLQKEGVENWRTNFGISFGGGISVKISERKVYLFVEAQYNYNFTTESEKSYIPIKLGFIFLPYLNF